MVIRVREMSGKILPVVQVKIKSVQKQLDPRSGPGDSKLYTYPIFFGGCVSKYPEYPSQNLSLCHARKIIYKPVDLFHSSF